LFFIYIYIYIYTGLPGRDCQDNSARTGLPARDC
jgi:hypothetical protein